jgi:Tfp pilus assembly protein PilN
MRQQINLYQPIFSRERRQLSSVTLVSAVGAIVATLLGISFYAHLRVGQLAQEVDAMRERAAQQEQMVATVGELHAARGNPAQIEARVEQLTETIAARKRALNVLQAGAAGQTVGFAARLEALARRHVDGLWIDSLVLSGTNGSMTLQGATLNADTVPVYLQGLTHERALAGTRFDDFVIERPARAALPQTVDSDDEEGAAPKVRAVAAEKHIRFRAGSKALTANQPEATT